MKTVTRDKRRDAKRAYVEGILALAREYPKIATGSGSWTTEVSKAVLMEKLIEVRKSVNATPEGRRGLETGKACSSPPNGHKNDNGIHATTLYQFLDLGIEKGNKISCMGHYFEQAFRWALHVIRNNPNSFPKVRADDIEKEIEGKASVIAFNSFGELCEECFGTTNAHMDGCSRLT